MTRLGLGLLALALATTPLTAADPVDVVVTGKVLPLAKALDKLGVKVDADSPGVALVTEKGELHALVKDPMSRLLFLDKRLQDRQVQLTTRAVPGTQLLRVTAVHTLKDGKLHEVYYWCDNCQLRANEPGACKCCGGDTTLVETPVKPKPKS